MLLKIPHNTEKYQLKRVFSNSLEAAVLATRHIGHRFFIPQEKLSTKISISFIIGVTQKGVHGINNNNNNNNYYYNYNYNNDKSQESVYDRMIT